VDFSRKVCYEISLCENRQPRLVESSRPIVVHLYFGQKEPTLQRGYICDS